jgi:hypothetical protein
LSIARAGAWLQHGDEIQHTIISRRQKMSIIARLVAWLSAFARPASVANPDCLALRDWADLPTHHPRCD